MEKICGIPKFMYLQLFKKLYQVFHLYFEQPHTYMREAMNVAYHLGMVASLAKARIYKDH
jgi:hypothetical protein